MRILLLFLQKTNNDMCTINTHDDNEFTIEIDSEVYNQDFDEAYPGEEEITQTETDVLFE